MNKDKQSNNQFFDDIRAKKVVWLATQNNNILMNKDEQGTVLLFLWSSKELILDYLENVEAVDVNGVEWPIATLGNLFQQVKQIEAIAVNPTGSSKQIITYNTDEFEKYL